MAIIPYSRELTTDELRNVAVDLTDALDEGEFLTGAPTIEADDGDITITSGQVSAESKKINGKIVPAGKAVLFKVASEEVERYTVKILCGTDGGQTIEVAVVIRVVATSVA